MKTVFCSSDKVKTLLELKKDGKVSQLTHIVYFDEATQNDLDLSHELGVTMIRYENAIAEGKSLSNV